MKSLSLLPIGILLRSYLLVAFILVYVQQQKAKRAEKKAAQPAS